MTPGTEPAETAPAEQPLIAVAKGDPTPEELAALAAVVLSLDSGAAPAPEKPGARHWIRRQQLQLAPRPGPGSWKRSRG
ncbi:acyl-CoA carboxylase subunit epsilon [Arthrobacter sp. U41]|uniref:acyl-CoA carboxylase subunit epsilon n=1 Tax=Arthrobacter sp. U41 TaxID=1849032 RepID=UPI0011A38346|nr:acyl-CoA carboxylase subunit epsilon [Arthrobacter sp. U41]